MNLESLQEKNWWTYLDRDLQELLSEALILLELAKKWDYKFHDYSFVVFPAAKAYEGFLKKLFLDMGVINKEDYYGKHFRIGKSLNPTLDAKYRDQDWVYDDLTRFCGSENLPKKLWQTWKNSRNLVTHWFPNEQNVISLVEAEKRIFLVLEAIDEAFSECGVQLER